MHARTCTHMLEHTRTCSNTNTARRPEYISNPFFFLIYPNLCHSVTASFNLSVCLSLCLSVCCCLSVAVCLSHFPSLSVSVCLSVLLSVCCCVCLSVTHTHTHTHTRTHTTSVVSPPLNPSLVALSFLVCLFLILMHLIPHAQILCHSQVLPLRSP